MTSSGFRVAEGTAGFGKAIVLAVQYRETVEDVGMGVFRHCYWPWYVRGQGDYVNPRGRASVRTEVTPASLFILN